MNKCIKCGSYAFNLYKEGIDQGGLCDVHYWQGRAHRAEALAQPEQQNCKDGSCDCCWTQPQQEPLAYIRKDQLQQAAQSPMLCEVTPEPRQDRIGIYTTPPQRKPLTDEQIEKLLDKVIADKKTKDQIGDFARAIEAAHGIKGNT